MGRQNVPIPTHGRFGSRNSAGLGGNRHAGPFNEFPLGRAAFSYNYFEYFNDFTGNADFDTQNFEWNRFDGSDTAYADTNPGTAIARTPDWLITEIGAGSGTTGTGAVGELNTVANLDTGIPYGVLRVVAGSTDSTGAQVTRAPAGSNVGAILPVVAQTITGASAYGSNAANRTPHRYFAVGYRAVLNENGTATQSAIYLGFARDEGAILTTAGAATGTNGGVFGFFKPLASNALGFISRNSANGTAVTTGTIVPGVGGADGTWFDVAAVCHLTTAEFSADLYFNRQYVTTYRTTTGTQMPATDAYAPSIAVVNGVGCDATLGVDYVWAISERV